MIDKLKNNLPTIIAIFLVTAMTAFSELIGEKEILFPEIAAIAAGSLVSPKLSWNTSLFRVFISISFGSIIGVLIVLYIPLTLWLQMSAAFLIALLMLAFSGTGFAPMISSVVLPVMLQTKSIIYPISAVSLTLLIVTVRFVFDKNGFFARSDFNPIKPTNKSLFTDMLICWLIGSIVIAVSVQTGFKLITAPPLLVAFTEFRKANSAARKSPVKVVFVIVFSTFIGSLLRYLCNVIGIYEFIGAMIAISAVYLIMTKSKMFIPPAAALCVLAFLIPKNSLLTYPLLIAAGTAIFMVFSVIHVKKLFIRFPFCNNHQNV